MHFNTRSLLKNLPKLTDLLSCLPKLPNVIAISETKLSKDRENLIKISNYSFVSNNSSTNSGGVGYYLRSDLMFRERPDLGLNNDSVEDVWVELFSPFSKPVVVGTIYFHPGNNVNEFYASLEITINKLNASRQTVYLLGEFNINLLLNTALTLT